MTSKDLETRETNQTKNEESSSSFLLGALIGGVVGAAAAVLLTPNSGKVLRSTMNKQAGSLKEKTVQLRENVINIGNELVSKTSSTSQGIVKQSTEFLNKSRKIPKAVNERDEEINYIPIGEGPSKTKTTETSVDELAIRKKLEEAKRAFEAEELKVTH
jgi:gas vesicle protein